MKSKFAALLLLAVCAAIAGLLVAGLITMLIAALLFAGALVILGLISRGFRN